MNKNLILMLCVALITVGSCKKDIKADPTTDDCLVVKTTVSYQGATLSNEYTYDNLGRVVLEKIGPGYETSYAYSNNKIIAITKEPGTQNTTTYALDASGKITSLVSGANYKMEFTYNSENYLIEIKEIVNNQVTRTEKLTFTDGNLTSLKLDNTQTITFTYGTALARANFLSPLESPYPEELRGALRKYFGKDSKNLVTKVSYSDTAVYSTLSYDSDNKQNIIKITGASVPADPDDAFTANLEYKCK